jgi:hypothetical protein
MSKCWLGPLVKKLTVEKLQFPNFPLFFLNFSRASAKILRKKASMQILELISGLIIDETVVLGARVIFWIFQ